MITQELKETVSYAIVSSCSERCKLIITNNQDLVIIKGELLEPSKKMCDCLIFKNDEKIILVELKSNSLRTSSIKEKFKNSGKEAITLVHQIDSKIKYSIYLALLAKGYKNFIEHDKLRRAKINIEGKEYSINLSKCGCTLESLIPQ